MTSVFIQFPFKDVPLKRGPKTKFYTGLAKVARTGPDYRGQLFVVSDLLPEATFFDEDFEPIEKHLERRSLNEILGLLKQAEAAAGPSNG